MPVRYSGRGLGPVGAVDADLDPLERDQAVGDHRVELGEDGPQAILVVDHLDEDG